MSTNDDPDDRHRLAWQVEHYRRLADDARVLGLRELEARRRQTLRLLQKKLQAMSKEKKA
jgi:hypothetical protein